MVTFSNKFIRRAYYAILVRVSCSTLQCPIFFRFSDLNRPPTHV
jgi:hypothetical protein